MKRLIIVLSIEVGKKVIDQWIMRWTALHLYCFGEVKPYLYLCVSALMKKLFFISVIVLAGMPMMAQSQCYFKSEGPKPRKDQYSKSSKDNIDKSKKDMADQTDEFDKKKYQAEVKNGKAAEKKRKTEMRYY